jgi:hypothetical protein
MLRKLDTEGDCWVLGDVNGSLTLRGIDIGKQATRKGIDSGFRGGTAPPRGVNEPLTLDAKNTGNLISEQGFREHYFREPETGEVRRIFLPRTPLNKLIARKDLVGSAGFWKAEMSVMSTRTSMFGDFRPGASRWSDTFSSLHVKAFVPCEPRPRSCCGDFTRL